MRINKIYTYILIAMATLALQSCLKDQEDIFEDSASIRMQKALDNAKSVLTSSDNGWVFDYFPDSQKAYGGYVYAVKFDNTHATVWSELAPGENESSLYKMTNDNGPMLSFDSYNTLMHFFATPWGSSVGSGGYEAYDGDFEFMIMEVTNDLITLKGKRTGNIMYLHRLNEDPNSYIEAASDMADNQFLTSISGNIGSTSVQGSIDLDVRYMSFTMPGTTNADGSEETANEYGAYFVNTPTGIRFPEPLEVNGVTIDALNYDVDALTYTGTDSNGGAVQLAGDIPDTYAFFDEYLGDFTITSNNTRKNNVTIEGDKKAGTFTIKGINPQYNVVGKYIKSKGIMEVVSQQVAIDSSNGQLIWFCMWGLNPATGSGSITWSTDAGVYFIKDPENPGTFTITSNGYDGLSYPPNSFAAYYFTGTVGGTPRGQATSKWRPLTTANTYAQMTYLQTMVKR